jgi:hypothetical protein
MLQLWIDLGTGNSNFLFFEGVMMMLVCFVFFIQFLKTTLEVIEISKQ